MPRTPRALPVAVLALVVSACAEEATPPATPPPPPAAPPPVSVAPPVKLTHAAPRAPVALDEYFKTVRVRGLSFSHDEKLIAMMSDKGGRPDLWVEPIEGGPGTQITHVEGFVHSYAFSPTA